MRMYRQLDLALRLNALDLVALVLLGVLWIEMHFFLLDEGYSLCCTVSA